MIIFLAGTNQDLQGILFKSKLKLVIFYRKSSKKLISSTVVRVAQHFETRKKTDHNESLHLLPVLIYILGIDT